MRQAARNLMGCTRALGLDLLPSPLSLGLRHTAGDNDMANATRLVPMEQRSEGMSRYITFLLMLVLAAGSIAIILPTLISQPGLLTIEDRYLPHFFLGLMAIAVLFNIYLLTQKWNGDSKYSGLLEKLVADKKRPGLSLAARLSHLLVEALALGGFAHNRHASHLG